MLSCDKYSSPINRFVLYISDISLNYKLFRQFCKMELHRVIKPFSGVGSTDITAWLTKVELVATLANIKQEDLVSVIPLYLEGGALAVYLEMCKADRDDIVKLKKALTRAFSDSPFTAYSKLKGMRWAGEPVDIFVTDVRKLVKESGFEEGEHMERVVRLAFVTAMPEKVSAELQQVKNVEDVAVAELLDRARILLAKGHGGMSVDAGAAASGSKGMFGGRPGSKGAMFGGARPGPMKCWDCGGPHPVKYCPSNKVKCWQCGGPHLARVCTEKEAAGCQIETVRGVLNRVPVVEVKLDGRPALALVDSGCSTSMIKCRQQGEICAETSVMAFDGREVKCFGYDTVQLSVGTMEIGTRVRVTERLVGDVDVILGMDVIEKLGGVTIMADKVVFGEDTGVICATVTGRERSPDIQDDDFDAWFEGDKWTVRYKWNETGPPQLSNTVGKYKSNLGEEKERMFDTEVHRWIEEGVLVPWKGDDNGVLPLMAVDQPTKGKVRPVLDYRELNKHVSCHTGDEVIDVCADKLREWRQVEGETELVDLKAAYLQIRVTEDLWKYQLVRFKGKLFCLTRLGFGLSAAPRIMSKILKCVLKKDKKVGENTSSYVDDIYVKKDVVSGDVVVNHLKKHGLIAKAPEALDGGAALGLKLEKGKDGELKFSRANEIPEVPDRLTKKELFSLCGKLVGHYPVAGWLRAACSYIKRHAEGDKWTDYVGDETRIRIVEVIEEVRKADPVNGRWQVPKTDKGEVWTDASDLATGVVVEINGIVAEDGTWMRKKDDYNHINVAELEAVLKGINMCVNWGLKDIVVHTDSATVQGWLKITMTGERRVKTKGAAEILVKRRLGIFKSLIDELQLRVEVRLVKSSENKADVLTRVWKKWLVNTSEQEDTASMSVEETKQIHDQHHMGVERTWFLAKKVDPSVSKETVKKVVRQCVDCQCIDPAPTTHVGGQLSVSENWTRASIDIVHYLNIPYLSLVDCGPGRFAIWRKMRGESAVEICDQLDNICYERGPLKEVLLDNAPSFRSDEIKQLLKKWNIKPIYRAAWRASGNGIVERHHRTIKTMAARTNGSPIEAVYWYNMTPKEGQREESVPHKSVYSYEWRMESYHEREEIEEEEPECELTVGDAVWVKPGNARCTTRWKEGTVTHVNSPNNVDVDGMARHILDVRPRMTGDNERDVPSAEDGEVQSDKPKMNVAERRFPERKRTNPVWMKDFF